MQQQQKYTEMCYLSTLTITGNMLSVKRKLHLVGNIVVMVVIDNVALSSTKGLVFSYS